LLQNNNILP